MIFRITIGTSTGTITAVRARNVEHAAQVQARRWSRQAIAVRCTGSPGMSGYFAAYRFDRRVQAQNQIGSAFHVRGAA